MHYSTFTVKIALDDENIPHHTLVIDNKNGEKLPMAGLDEKNLLAFIAVQSGLELSAEYNPSVFPPPAPSAETTSLPVFSLFNETPPALTGFAAVEETVLEILSPESPVLEPPLISPASSRPEIRLRFVSLNVALDQDASPRRRLKANMSFRFILKLKLTGFEELGDRQIPYPAMVNA